MAADENFHGIRFTRIMLPNFTAKLSIPKALGKHLSKCRGDIATIARHDGKFWHVNLFVKHEEMYVGGSGWRAFVQDNQLELGYLLILRYRGNRVFSFRVFDRTTFEKTCSGSAAAQKERTKRDWIEVSHTEEEEENTNSRSEPAMHSATYVRCHFETTLKPRNFTHSFMFIPETFRKSSGLSSAHREVLVEDLNGKPWKIGLYHMRQSTRIQMTRGWTEFARSNKLEVGDRVGFELVPPLQVESRVLLHLQMYKLRRVLA